MNCSWISFRRCDDLRGISKLYSGVCMRYEDLDGVSKFQMKSFSILMLKIEKDSEDFVFIDKLAEKIEQSYIVEKNTRMDNFEN